MKYYKTRLKAEENRNHGDRIYFVSNKGYYIIEIEKKLFFNNKYIKMYLQSEGYAFINIISLCITIIGIVSLIFKLYSDKDTAIVLTMLAALITYLTYEIIRLNYKEANE